MSPAIIGKEHTHLDVTDSTNTYLMSLAANGAQEGLVVTARCQTAGQGRRGRSFQSTAGLGLYLSVLVRPKMSPIEVPELTAWTAAAVCDGIEAACGRRPGIKWPNDLVADGHKLGGILTELALNPDGSLSHVVIGIGINLSHRRQDFDPELRDMAVSLSQWLGQPPDGEKLTQSLIESLDRMYSRFPAGRQEYLDRYRSDCINTGNQVRVLSARSSREGTALGIDDRFRLLVRWQDGTQETLSAGEVSVRGLYGYV